MIKLLREGSYQLIETKSDTKILTLDKKNTYAWVQAKGIGEILLKTHTSHKTDAVLSIGAYRLYDVENEPQLTDLLHLELSVGGGVWQGYLLLKGLPVKKNRNRIIPTQEIITKATSG